MSTSNLAIVVGVNMIAKSSIIELINSGREVIVIWDDQESLTKLEKGFNDSKITFRFGDPTVVQVLERNNISNAECVLICTGNDTESLIVALTARELNKNARIVVAVQQEDIRQTMEEVGVTFITSPKQMAGRLMASASFEPDVVLFIDDITTRTFGSDVAEIRIGRHSPVLGKTIKEAEEMLVDYNGSLLAAIAKKEKRSRKYAITIMPDWDTKIELGDALVILGTLDMTTMAETFLNPS